MSGTPVVTASQLRALATSGGKPNKYGARKTTLPQLPGRTFDSKHEADIAGQLMLREQVGEIRGLVFQPRFHLVVKGQKIADYLGDFLWWERVSTATDDAVLIQLEDGSWAGVKYNIPTGQKWIVADAKSAPTRTAVYRLKAKLMLALHGITIREL